MLQTLNTRDTHTKDAHVHVRTGPVSKPKESNNDTDRQLHVAAGNELTPSPGDWETSLESDLETLPVC